MPIITNTINTLLIVTKIWNKLFLEICADADSHTKQSNFFGLDCSALFDKLYLLNVLIFMFFKILTERLIQLLICISF